jgi:hypothetical protein
VAAPPAFDVPSTHRNLLSLSSAERWVSAVMKSRHGMEQPNSFASPSESESPDCTKAMTSEMV